MPDRRPTLGELRQRQPAPRRMLWAADKGEKCRKPDGEVNHTVAWWEGHAAKVYCGRWIGDREMQPPQEDGRDCRTCESRKAKIRDAYGSLRP